VKDALLHTHLMRSSDGVRLVVEGEIDIAGAEGFREALRHAIDFGGGDVIVDLAAVTYIDSAGCHCLVSAREHAVERHVCLRVAPMSLRAERVFAVTGLTDYLAGRSQPVS